MVLTGFIGKRERRLATEAYTASVWLPCSPTTSPTGNWKNRQHAALAEVKHRKNRRWTLQFSVGHQGVFRTPEGQWRQRNPLMRGKRVPLAGHCTFSFHLISPIKMLGHHWGGWLVLCLITQFWMSMFPNTTRPSGPPCGKQKSKQPRGASSGNWTQGS